MTALAPYQGLFLTPGMLGETYTVESDLSDIIYGSLHLCTYLNYAVISGAARDAGNTGNTTVLRPGLIMGKIAASGKWAQWDPDAVDGTQYARGILLTFGLNTQLNGANADRFLASILVKGNVNAEGLCIESSSSYGLARTGDGLTVREHLVYNISFADDFECDLAFPLSAR